MKKVLLIIYFLYLYLFCPAQINISDSLALVDIYNATNGSNWTHSTNWLTNHVKTWYGVTVPTYPGDSTRVAQLNLSNNNLTGYIPSSIDNLTYIAVINLGNNNLIGTIPQTIGRLIQLQSFYVYNNQLSGNLTDSICKMTGLYSLSISYNNFTGNIPDSLNQLPHLNSFYIQNNQFESLPDFSGIPNADIAAYYVQNNHLTFSDIEPNMTLSSFVCPFCEQYYAPQFDSINNKIDTTIFIDSVFSMHCTLGGQHNIYQWTKDTVVLPLATDSVLTLNGAVPADSGVYACKVTNSVVTGLTYYRRPITVHVDKLTESLTDYAEPINVINISPNPVNNTLNIESSSKFSQLFISDILGNVVIRQQVNNTAVSVDVSGLGKGLYFVKMVSENGFVVKRFLKE